MINDNGLRYLSTELGSAHPLQDATAPGTPARGIRPEDARRRSGKRPVVID
jgi:hypothetical protein